MKLFADRSARSQVVRCMLCMLRRLAFMHRARTEKKEVNNEKTKTKEKESESAMSSERDEMSLLVDISVCL